MNAPVENYYAAPRANLEVPDVAALVEEQRFYVVSGFKFVLLYLGTAGLYAVYWSYRHWAQFKRATNGSEWPVMRGLFAIFFMHSLLGEADHAIRRRGEDREWSPRALATAIVLLMIVNSAADRLVGRVELPVAIELLTFVPMFALCATMLAAQRALNQAAGDPEGRANSRIGWANGAWLVGFGIIWLFTLAYFVARITGLPLGP